MVSVGSTVPGLMIFTGRRLMPVNGFPVACGVAVLEVGAGAFFAMPKW
jgi:hypothetical protein